jgi:hypothetical protein
MRERERDDEREEKIRHAMCEEEEKRLGREEFLCVGRWMEVGWRDRLIPGKNTWY